MGTVTATFAAALAEAAGFELTETGALRRDGRVHRQVPGAGDTLSDADYFALIDWIAAQHADRLGLVAGYARAIHVDRLGVLGLALKTAPTLRLSIARAERYFRLLTDTVAYRLDATGALARFAILRQTAPHPAHALRNECALAGFARVFATICGPELRLAAVSFRHAPAADPAGYAELFSCPVAFGAAEDAIALDPAMLDLPTRLGDPALSGYLGTHLEAELRARPDQSDFERALTRHLTEALGNGIPRAAGVARALGLSERTLYRRLTEAGLTFHDALERTQQGLAQSLLARSDCSIAEVAFLTGFAEQSSFTRAFRRWSGASPGAWRRAALPG